MNSISEYKKSTKRRVRSLYWFFYGKTVRNPALPSKIRTVLYICKGNIVRSPFAEHVSNRIMAEEGVNPIALEFSSAGIVLPETRTSPMDAMVTAKKFKVELHEHKARLVNCSMIESNDVIVVMDVWQQKIMKKLFPEHTEKIFLLPLYDSDYEKYNEYYWKYNIVDPYGKDVVDYYNCYKRMSAVLKTFLNMILSANRRK